ncbi:hypothetical protein GCM10009846_28830 [Agrococcus versicolor]|uniref:MFS transporter n=1 Tax=Agrococcus versicolor TaxID=501482 RepID=A0ABP5MRS7_9MICO
MSSSSGAGVGTRLDLRRRALAHSLLVTGLTTVATGCAHSLAGGVAPSPLLLATAAMVTLLILAPVLGAAATWPRRIVAVALAQVVQHALYSLPQPSAAPGSAGGHAHHGAETIPVAAEGAAMHAHGDMLLAHVVAGALTLVALRVGIAAIGAVLGAVRGDRLVRMRMRAVPLGVARPAAVGEARPIERPATPVLRSPLVRRGPPALTV